MPHKSSRRVFLAAAAPICLGTAFADGNGPAFYDPFTGDSLDRSKWRVENRAANGTSPGHSGFFTPENIDCSMGMLRMKLVQSTAAKGLVSYGASIQSTAKFGYGRYQFVMRMASTSASPDGTGEEVGGSVSSAYVFVNNSETELDIEYLGDRPGLLHLTNWCNTDPSRHPSGGFEGYNLIRQYEKLPLLGAADPIGGIGRDGQPQPLFISPELMRRVAEADVQIYTIGVETWALTKKPIELTEERNGPAELSTVVEIKMDLPKFIMGLPIPIET